MVSVPLTTHPGPPTVTTGGVPPPLDGFTGTVRFFATCAPALLMATHTYVLVVVGFTVRLPFASTFPIPEITTRAAPVARQVRTTALPGTVLTAGFAVKDVITGGPGGVGGSNNDASKITAWVESHFTAKTVGGVTVYDLATGNSTTSG